MNTKHIVWAESDSHTTYAVCYSYKEAVAKRKAMKTCLFGYKFSIEKVNY